MIDEFDLMECCFRSITLSLYKYDDLNPLACQIGACILIEQASFKSCSKEELDFYFLDKGVSLHFYSDLIYQFFNGDFDEEAFEGLVFIDVFPYQKYKSRLIDSLLELANGGFIKILGKTTKEDFEIEITEKLNRYSIPYAVLNNKLFKWAG